MNAHPAGAPSRRCARLLDVLAGRGADAMLVTDPLSVRYLTGFTGSHGALCLARDAALLVTDGRYAEQAREEAPGFEIGISADAPVTVLAGEIRRRGYAAVAAEMNHLTWAQYRDLADLVGESRLRPEKGLVASLRLVKEEAEIAAIRRSAALVDEVFGGLVTWLAPGMTERAASARINYEMQARGATGPSFETIVASGAREALAAHGLEDRFTHALGHGVGLAIHEGPRLSAKSEETLAAGMVVTVEPGVYLPGWGGVRIEDLVVVRDDGPEYLSRSPRELVSAGGLAAAWSGATSLRKDA